MATQRPVKALTRDQLSRIAGGNQEIIRRLEQLFALAGEETPRAADEASIDAGTAQETANAALATLEEISESLAVIASMPHQPVMEPVEWLQPPNGDQQALGGSGGFMRTFALMGA